MNRERLLQKACVVVFVLSVVGSLLSACDSVKVLQPDPDVQPASELIFDPGALD